MSGSLSKVFREQITSYFDRVVDGRIAWWMLRLLSGELNSYFGTFRVCREAQWPVLGPI